MARYGEYLRRRGSVWWVCIQYPRDLWAEMDGKRKLERSLHTADRRLAQALAAPLIAEHKNRLLHAQNRRGVMIDRVRTRRVKVTGFEWLYSLGDRTEKDGNRVISTEGNVLFIREGAIVCEEKNDLRSVTTFNFEPVRLWRKTALFDRALSFDVRLERPVGPVH